MRFLSLSELNQNWNGLDQELSPEEMCIRDSSYTALDVAYWSLYLREKPWIDREFSVIQRDAADCGAHPVSYTHLDVYKRQHPGHAEDGGVDVLDIVVMTVPGVHYPESPLAGLAGHFGGDLGVADVILVAVGYIVALAVEGDLSLIHI